jgi:phage/plasmid primase-like uncharacterized protein
MTIDNLLARLKRARRSGNGYVALCPGHDDRHHSFSLTQEGGRILLYCHAGCTVRDICDALGIRVGDLFDRSGDTRNPNARYTDEQRLRYARKIWECTHTAVGTVVETYLRSRVITIPVPSAIRFIPLRMHKEYGWPFPALVAGLQDAAGAFTAISITWLSAGGTDKAPVDPVRKIYGPYCGGTVRLRSTGQILVLCEGIETGLSVAQACPELAVWCALSATNLARSAIPPNINTVIIAADADPAGEAAAQAAAARLAAEGRDVRIARPRTGTDFNDVLRTR